MNRRQLEREETEKRVETLHQRIEGLTPLLELAETPQWGAAKKLIAERREALVQSTHLEHDAARLLKRTGEIGALAWVLDAVDLAAKRVRDAVKERENIRQRLGV